MCSVAQNMFYPTIVSVIGQGASQNVFCGTECVLPYYSECDRPRSLTECVLWHRMCSVAQNVFSGTECVLHYYSECDRPRSLTECVLYNRMCSLAQNVFYPTIVSVIGEEASTECVLYLYTSECVEQNVYCSTEWHRMCSSVCSTECVLWHRTCSRLP